jgi:hypothetical protein
MYLALPTSTWRTPGGRFFSAGSALIFSMAGPSLAPLLRSATIDSRRAWL